MHMTDAEAFSGIIEKHFGAKIICIKSVHRAVLSELDEMARRHRRRQIIRKNSFFISIHKLYYPKNDIFQVYDEKSGSPIRRAEAPPGHIFHIMRGWFHTLGGGIELSYALLL